MTQIPLLAMSDRQELYSMAYVQAIIAEAGFNISTPRFDRNSGDIYSEFVNDSADFIPNYQRLRIQIKCTYSHPPQTDGYIHYPLPVKNYTDLSIIDGEPRILVVVYVPRPDGTESWIQCMKEHTVFRYRAYWLSLMGRASTKNTANVTVSVPTSNSFDIQSLTALMTEMVANGNKDYACTNN